MINKVFAVFFFLALNLAALSAYSQVGCSNGTYIFTTTDGTYIQNNANTQIPVYKNSSKIYIRNWDGDPECGILRSLVSRYSKPPGSLKNPNSQCYISGIGYGSSLLNYNIADDSCNVNNVPIDRNIFFLIISVSLFGFYMILNQKKTLV